jgi:hypothetical protein
VSPRRSELGPFLVGIASLSGQAILLRELLARGLGNELILTFFLAVWLAGSALGARLFAWALHRRVRLFTPLILAGGLSIVFGICLARLVPLAGSVHGEVPAPGAVIVLGITVLFIPSLLTAGLFPVAAALAGDPGRAYVAEAIGALLGGMVSTLFFMLRIPSLVLLCLVLALLALGLLRRPIAWILAVGLSLFAIVGGSNWLDRNLYARGWENRHEGLTLVQYAFTPTRSLAVAEREEERWLYVDESPREPLDDPYRDDAVAALLLSAAPHVERVLLVDFGQATVAPALTGAGVSEVVCLLAEPEDTLLVPPSPGVGFRIGDPRRSLRSMPGTWDLIALSGSPAITVSSNRLWTREAFSILAEKLSPRGVVVALTPGGEAAVGPEAEGWRSSVGVSLQEAIGPVQLIDTDQYIFAASFDERIASFDPDTLVRRFERRDGELATYAAERFPIEYPRDRQRSLRPAPSNRDAQPAAFAFALGRWVRRAGLPVGQAHLPAVVIGVLLCVLLLIPLVQPPGPQRGAGQVLIATGAASLGLDLLVLMTYQARVGILQGGLGALLGAFLGGTALGALFATKFGGTSLSRFVRPVCAGQAALAVAATFTLPMLPEGPTIPATLLFALVACALGITCGLPFPVVARMTSSARAWAADAFGGILGALLFLSCIQWGIRPTGLALAILPLLAMTRFLGSGARTPHTVRP